MLRWDSYAVGPGAVIKLFGQFYMLYAGVSSSSAPQRSGLATSSDGIHWVKYSGNPILSPTPGSWDNAHVSGSALVYENGLLKMWYNAYGYGSWQIGYATSTFEPPAPGGATQVIPTGYKLYRSYPNPFNPAARIEYDVPNAGQVTIKISNELGQEIATLVNEIQSPSHYTTTWNAQNFASGLYQCEMKAGGFVQITKMLLVK